MTKSILCGTIAAALMFSASTSHARGPTPNLTEQERIEAANPIRPLGGSGQRVDCSDPLNHRQGGVDLKNATCSTGRGTAGSRSLVPTEDWNGGLHPKTH